MGNPDQTVLLKAKFLIDGTGRAAREDVALRIEGDKIAEVGHRDEVDSPSAARVIDLGDRTLMPGIVDAHMHFFGVASDHAHTLHDEVDAYRALRAAGEARRMVEAGITSARCLGSSISPSLHRAIDEGHVPGPRLVTAGEFICSSRGTWAHYGIGLPVDALKAEMIADGVDGLRQVVRRRIRQGASVIKVGISLGPPEDDSIAWGKDPFNQVATYSPEEIGSLVDEAHRQRLKVSAHCIGDDAVRTALAGGVDVIEHGHGINDETRKMLVAQNTVVVSTLSVMRSFQERAIHATDDARRSFQMHIDAQKLAFEKGLEAGVHFALGTDLIGYPESPQDTAAKEFEFAVEYGMDPMNALVAGTHLSSEVLGFDTLVGTIEKGKCADILGLDENPLKSITTLQNVPFVMQDGNIVSDKTIATGPEVRAQS